MHLQNKFSSSLGSVWTLVFVLKQVVYTYSFLFQKIVHQFSHCISNYKQRLDISNKWITLFAFLSMLFAFWRRHITMVQPPLSHLSHLGREH